MAEINPVLMKELRQRFRSSKTIGLLVLYLLLIGAFVLGFTYLNWRNAPGFYQPDNSRAIFAVLSMAQLFLLAFVTPGLMAGVISGERERQTLNILLTTRLSAWQIIWSKLVSSSAFVLLLLLATLPLYSIVFLYGGIAPGQVLGVFGYYLVTMFFFGCIGIACSSFFKRTGVSTITAYGLVFAISAGTALLSLFLAELERFRQVGTSGMAETPSFLFGVAQFLMEINPFYVLTQILSNGVRAVRIVDFALPYWGVYTLVYLVAGGLLLYWSARLLSPRKYNG